MIAGSDGKHVDLEYTPPTSVAGSRVAAIDEELRKLQNTVAHQAEEMAQLRNHMFALVARIYALEQGAAPK